MQFAPFRAQQTAVRAQQSTRLASVNQKTPAKPLGVFEFIGPVDVFEDAAGRHTYLKIGAGLDLQMTLRPSITQSVALWNIIQRQHGQFCIPALLVNGLKPNG